MSIELDEAVWDLFAMLYYSSVSRVEMTGRKAPRARAAEARLLGAIITDFLLAHRSEILQDEWVRTRSRALLVLEKHERQNERRRSARPKAP